MFLQGKGQSFVSWVYSKRAQMVQNDLAENEKKEKQMKQTIVESWQSVEMMKTSSTCPLPHPSVQCVIQGSSHQCQWLILEKFQKLASFPVPWWGGHHPRCKGNRSECVIAYEIPKIVADLF